MQFQKCFAIYNKLSLNGESTYSDIQKQSRKDLVTKLLPLKEGYSCKKTDEDIHNKKNNKAEIVDNFSISTELSNNFKLLNKMATTSTNEMNLFKYQNDLTCIQKQKDKLKNELQTQIIQLNQNIVQYQVCLYSFVMLQYYIIYGVCCK